MCGFYAFNKAWRACLLGIFLLCGAGSAWAGAQKGTVVHDGAMVYTEADFDSPVMATLRVGAIYAISTGKKGAFYKIRLRPGTVGWIADNDIHPGIVKEAVRFAEEMKRAKEKKKEEKLEHEEDEFSPHRSFEDRRFRGPVLSMIQFKETTLGGHPSDNLLFYGLQVAGPNTLFAGDTNTEANLLFHMGAPDYYGKATGNSGGGFIFLANFLFETTNPVSPTYNYFYGFGPMFKYSHFDLALSSGSTKTSYAADDMTIGAVFNFGLSFKISDYALRIDAKYYWEKQMYPGADLSFQWGF